MAYFLLSAGQPSAKRLLRRVSGLSTYRANGAHTNDDVIIRWGVTHDSDPLIGRILNPRDALDRTVSRRAMAKTLRRLGVRVIRELSDPGDGEPMRILRHYRVPLFDLIPLSCFRADGGSVWINQRISRIQESFHEVTVDDDKVSARVEHLAVRALHALGLDHGMVSIGMAQKGVLHVLDVTPNPVLNDRLLDLYAKAVAATMDREDRLSGAASSRALIGTDMELMLRNPTGRMVLASNYFSRLGQIGCDDRSVQFDGKRLPLLELRPEPASNPLELVGNLRHLMEDAVVTINRAKVEWRAGSMPFRPFSTGGHIHISGVPFSSALVRALDNFVGLPLMMVEDPRTAQLRRPRYGFLGDVRHKGYGGFEYRTPASFIVDPDVTAAAFCLAYITALYHRELPLSDLYDPTVQVAFYRGDTDALMPLLERNYASLRRLTAFERYRDYVDPLFEMIRAGQTWDENMDVRLAWGIPVPRMKRKRDSNYRRSGANAMG